jgi:outer membrane receptor protein involved in Fe transport
MKKVYTMFVVLGFLIPGFHSYAQFPGGTSSTGKSVSQTPPSIGHVYGKLVDSTGKSITGASVMLLQSRFDTVSKKRKEILLKGITTKANGEFSFADLPIMGALKLKISASGYKPIEQPVSFQIKPDASAAPAPGAGKDPAQAMANMSSMMNAFEKDLGNITLKEDIQQLQSVVVTASKPLVKMDIDKKVFNVEKNMVSAGGTALDVMKNVPSLQVDIDGNVKLRNAAPQIYIDGRPTTLSLDQIPADAIESVEVITNPSAKFDASGGNAGILNIVLKKNKKSGYNGNIMAGVDRRGGLNGGGNFNLRQDKINLSAAVMGNQMRNRTEGTTERIDLVNLPAMVTTQNNLNTSTGGFLFGRVGMDYFMTNRTTLSLSGVKVHGKFKPEETIETRYDTLSNLVLNSGYSQRLSEGTREFNATGFQAGMKHIFPREGEELTADLNFFSGKNAGDMLYTTNYLTKAEIVTGTEYQKQVSDGSNRFLTIQTDYVRPIGKKTKLETGLRAQLRNTVNNNYTSVKGTTDPDFILIPSATNNYKNSDNVYAAYVSMKSSIKDFGYQVGLRAESSSYQGELTNTGEQFSNSYPISLFPSVFLSQKLKNKQELQLSYTRRVNRPNFFQLIPYTDYTDSLNITQGNPNLKPEFTSSMEASYSKNFKGGRNILFSAYYKYTTDMITRYIKKEENPVSGQEDLINTYINANSGYLAGGELTGVNPITKWWDLTTNLNIYNSKINTENVSVKSQDAMWSWFGKLNSNFKLPKNYTIQLTADYQSKTNIPVNNGGQGFGPPMGQAQSASQGYIDAFWGMDVAIKKMFMKNNAASLTLSVTDIFATRISRQHAQSIYFIQNYSRINNPQMVRLNFSYRFGKMDMSLFKRQNMKSQPSEGMQMMQ